jgi:hypothetical protein
MKLIRYLILIVLFLYSIASNAQCDKIEEQKDTIKVNKMQYLTEVLHTNEEVINSIHKYQELGYAVFNMWLVGSSKIITFIKP